ncbi:MAG: hypothetical protein ACQEXQ_08825 [Bacillota bacterium]
MVCYDDGFGIRPDVSAENKGAILPPRRMKRETNQHLTLGVMA